MFIYVIKIVINPYKTDEFYETLRSISRQFLKAKGCLDYSVCRDTEKKNTVRVLGEWKTRQAMEKHFHSHEFEIFIGASRVLGETFEINIAEVSKSGGLELAREQMTSQDPGSVERN